MLDWAIIGAGVHGMHLALRLVQQAGVNRNALRIIDPHEAPLARWHRQTRATGMQSLRSSVAHHMGVPSRDLLDYALQHNQSQNLIGRYRRPPLTLFNAHCETRITQAELRDCVVRDQIEEILPQADGYLLRGAAQTLQAKNILLATGQPRLRWPDWARTGAAGPVIRHVFAKDFRLHEIKAGDAPLIVGGGLTAYQLALSIVDAGGTARIVCRHPPRLAAFDSDPCFLGPACLDGFRQEPDPSQRREIIQQARRPGSLPPYLLAQVRAAQDRDRLEVFFANPVATAGDRLLLADGRALTGKNVILATGFETQASDDGLIARIGEELALPRDELGYPKLTPTLEWRPRLYVCGRLAELELGPAAGNIAGARMAGRRLVAALTGRE